MRSREPEIRGVQTHSLLAALQRLPPADRAAFDRRADARVLEEARAALPIAWVPMSVHMHISDRVRDVVGPTRNVAVWREAMRMSFDRPLLRSFVSATTGVLGLTPLALLKHGGKVYEVLCRNIGSLAYEPRGEYQGVLTLADFPADRFRFITYVEGLAGCLEATLDVCRRAGSIDVVAQDDAKGRVVYVAKWNER